MFRYFSYMWIFHKSWVLEVDGWDGRLDVDVDGQSGSTFRHDLGSLELVGEFLGLGFPLFLELFLNFLPFLLILAVPLLAGLALVLFAFLAALRMTFGAFLVAALVAFVLGLVLMVTLGAAVRVLLLLVIVFATTVATAAALGFLGVLRVR
jgi:hypothetical protein